MGLDSSKETKTDTNNEIRQENPIIKTTMAENDISLPTSPLAAKTIPLDLKLKVEERKRRRNEMTMRECLLKYAKEAEEADQQMARYGMEPKNQSRNHVQDKTPVLGSDNRKVFSEGNYGFFDTVMEAYNNHYSLRTCADDWWYTIIRKIAVAIDENSKSDKVRKFFVSHEGKKTLTVEVGPSVYGVDYSWFLDQMTQQISDNIKVPNYVNLLKADFSTSTPTNVIVSEITTMASLQEFFEYEMMTMCGIPSLLMEGEEKDWINMKDKFIQLRDLLGPIRGEIGLNGNWWKDVEHICEELIKTYNGKPDTKWWSHIFSYKGAWGSGAQDTYDGWFISKLLGLGSIHTLSALNNGVITVPMKITNGMTGNSEQSAFAAGIAGYEMFKEDAKWASVKAVHGWTLMLEPKSQFREEIIDWETKLGQGA